MNKEIDDALHMLLHCSLKDTEYETQREQFEFIYKYIENLEEENQELKKQLEEVEFIVGLRKKRNLIHKFDKEYDDEDKKKNPNRDYAGIVPDAEEVYRRYYSMKNQQKEFIEFLENEKDRLARVCNNICEDKFDEADDILQKYKSIIGVSDEKES